MNLFVVSLSYQPVLRFSIMAASRYESNVGNGAVDAATCNVQLDKEERSGLHLITLAAESKRGRPTHDVGMINISMMPNAEKSNEKIKGNETLSSS